MRPVMELNDEVREKAAGAIRQLETLVAEPQSIFVTTHARRAHDTSTTPARRW
jgi:hypothetical protein